MSTTSRGYLTNFDGGYGLSDVQNHALGYIGQDPKGQMWSYVMFTGAVGVGYWVQDDRPANVNAAAVGPIKAAGLTEQAGEDSRFLYIVRNTNDREEMFVGAFGWAADVGFTIASWIPQSADVARIDVDILHKDDELFYNPSRLRPTTWKDGELTPPVPGSIGIFLPGRVVQGTTATHVPDIRGVAQRSITASDASPENPVFGWVLQKGIGICQLSDTVGANHRFLNPATGGEFDSANSRTGVTAARVVRDLGATANDDDLVLAEFNIENNATAFGGPAPRRAVGAGPAVIS